MLASTDPVYLIGLNYFVSITFCAFCSRSSPGSPGSPCSHPSLVRAQGGDAHPIDRDRHTGTIWIPPPRFFVSFFFLVPSVLFFPLRRFISFFRPACTDKVAAISAIFGGDSHFALKTAYASLRAAIDLRLYSPLK